MEEAAPVVGRGEGEGDGRNREAAIAAASDLSATATETTGAAPAVGMSLFIDAKPLDDEGVLTLIELSSTHPVILTANTRLQKELLDASNKACVDAAELEALSRQQLQHMQKSFSDPPVEKKEEQCDQQHDEAGQQTRLQEADEVKKTARASVDQGTPTPQQENTQLQHQPVLVTLEKVAEAGAVALKERRALLEGQMKRCRMLLDACNGLVVDLDSLDFSTLKPLWGDERSIRQSRKCLTQLIEKMTDRLETANKFLKSIFVRLPPLSPASPAGSSNSAGEGGRAQSSAAAVAAPYHVVCPGSMASERSSACASAAKDGVFVAASSTVTPFFSLAAAVDSSSCSFSAAELSAASQRRDSTDEHARLTAGDLRGSEPGSPSVGRGRGVLPAGAGRGRGVLLAAGRGRGVGAGRGASSTSSSSSDSEDSETPAGRRGSSCSTGGVGSMGSSGGRRGAGRERQCGAGKGEGASDAGDRSSAAAEGEAAASAGGLQQKKRSRQEDETQQQQQHGEEAKAAAEHHPGRQGREAGGSPPRRWKRKAAANVDWLLKCRTKLCELKERTVRKAVSDVFIKERTVQETIEFMNHNADKLQTVAEKPKAAITSDDRRIFMRSIESYIAGLDKNFYGSRSILACSLVAKQAMNKRQLMSLFESACKVEKFQTPYELLVEMKNTVSLLQTFAYMPPSRDDDSSS